MINGAQYLQYVLTELYEVSIINTIQIYKIFTKKIVWIENPVTATLKK